MCKERQNRVGKADIELQRVTQYASGLITCRKTLHINSLGKLHGWTWHEEC
jgi:hypothetical protein